MNFLRLKRRSRHPQELKLNLLTWSSLLRYALAICRKFTRVLLMMAVLVGLCFGVKALIVKIFHQNDRYALKVIKLNPNCALDEQELLRLTSLNPKENLFKIDINQVKARLEASPTVEKAEVSRHLPDTLAVHIVPKIPLAWVHAGDTEAEAKKIGQFLVDSKANIFPCTPYLFRFSRCLPLVMLSETELKNAREGKEVTGLRNGLNLLQVIHAKSPNLLPLILSIRQSNAWSIRVDLERGMIATFGIGEHADQIERFNAVLRHAENKNYLLKTINLIPKHNVPITVQEPEAFSPENSNPPPR